MTPLEHNKYLGIAHVVYGVIHLLMIGVMGVYMLVVMTALSGEGGRGGAPPMAFFGVVMALAAGFSVLMSVPKFIAGYAFLKRKPWAKIAGIVSAVTSAPSIPLGTALCAYTFWFLFSEPGKIVYEGYQPNLPPPPPANWDPMNRPRAEEHAPPPAPAN